MRQADKWSKMKIDPGPERGKASFSPPEDLVTRQLGLNYYGPEGPRASRTESVIQRPPDEVITYRSCAGAYQQFFDFFLVEETRERPIPTRLKHDLTLRRKVESRRPRCDETFNLRELLEEVGEFYSIDTEHLAIGWFHGRGGKTTIELGYVLLDEDVILINEILNTMPRYVIEAIVAHELCHLIKPPLPKNGRLIKHHSEFKQCYMLHPSAKLYERHRQTIHAFLFN
jgi:predicted SprT family Zn-dependent metalloprotease